MAETAKKRRTEKVSWQGGLERKLDVAAWGLLCLGVIVGLRMLDSVPNGGVVFVRIVGEAMIAWLLFRSLAEIIRLLKLQAGLPYGGRVTTATKHVESSWECTGCGAPLYDLSVCDNCGREIEGIE